MRKYDKAVGCWIALLISLAIYGIIGLAIWLIIAHIQH